MFQGDAVGHGKSHTGTFPCWFCREEGFENLIHDCFIDPGSRVFNPDSAVVFASADFQVRGRFL